MSKDGARDKLDAARRCRMLGEIEKTEEFSAAAYFLAVETGDGETAYHAHACLGFMRLWRSEYPEAFVHYREAFSVAEGYNLTRWIAPACHDMYISGTEAGYSESREQADPALADWHLPGARTWAFVHDIYRAIVRGNTTREVHKQAVDFLRQSAISASWHIKSPPPGGPWYPEYKAKFERTTTYASMCHACGILHREGALDRKHLEIALNFFEMAADAQASDEGYAQNLIDVAKGAKAGGMCEAASGYLARANMVAGRRGEFRIVEEVSRIRAGWVGD